MQVQLTPDQASALMLRMPAEARGPLSGFRYDDGTLTIPDPFAGAAQAIMAAANWEEGDLVAYAAAKRYVVETQGIDFGGATVRTDRESQAMIAGAFNLVQVDPSRTIAFKAAGGFVTLDAAAIQTLAVAVGDHVQQCFAKEGEVVAGVDDGSITTRAQVDAAFATL